MDHLALESDARSDRRLLVAAAASALVIVASVVTATIIGELPEALWLLLVPIGIFGGIVACATCLALALVRRFGRSGLQSP